jgi:hypothetical protein
LLDCRMQSYGNSRFFSVSRNIHPRRLKKTPNSQRVLINTPNMFVGKVLQNPPSGCENTKLRRY